MRRAEAGRIGAGGDDGAAEDAALLAAYARGDAGAARRLAERLVPRLLGWTSRLLGDADEAEDVVQETMLRLWKAAPRWRADGGARIDTWAFRVARNLVIDRHRRRARVEVGLDGRPEAEDPAPGALAGLVQADRRAALEAALAALPERQRAAVMLRDIEGFSNPEVAEVLGVSVEAVESLLARGRRALRRLLEPRREEIGFGE